MVSILIDSTLNFTNKIRQVIVFSQKSQRPMMAMTLRMACVILNL